MYPFQVLNSVILVTFLSGTVITGTVLERFHPAQYDPLFIAQ